jgi:hypothetical protein
VGRDGEWEDVAETILSNGYTTTMVGCTRISIQHTLGHPIRHAHPGDGPEPLLGPRIFRALRLLGSILKRFGGALGSILKRFGDALGSILKRNP